jgi:hypothetical protein
VICHEKVVSFLRKRTSRMSERGDILDAEDCIDRLTRVTKSLLFISYRVIVRTYLFLFYGNRVSEKLELLCIYWLLITSFLVRRTNRMNNKAGHVECGVDRKLTRVNILVKKFTMVYWLDVRMTSSDSSNTLS